jgi:HK97 family phage major capsid protein
MEIDTKKIETQLEQISSEWGKISPLPDQLKTLEQAISGIRVDVDHIRRARLNENNEIRTPGKMSRRGAELLGAAMLGHVAKRGMLGEVIGDAARREAQIKDARDIVQRWTGQTASEFPLPTPYSGEIDALIADYGVVRRVMTPWPLSGGTDKPPRHKTGMSFAKITINTAFGELNPAFEFASLESHKVGGVVITPRELFEQSIVDIGMYLGLLAAKEFGRVEDYWGLRANGSATYESIEGVVDIAYDNAYYVQMSTGNTAPADVTAANLRAVKAKVSSAAYPRASWFINPTFQAYLPELNTQANQYVYRELGDGSVRLLGHPVVWTDVMPAYSEDASVSTHIAIFGDLSWWWFGKRPSGPRIDTSDQVLFTADQIATRFIEELDFDYRALAAAATLMTAAS